MGASQSCAVLPRHTFLHKICQMLWLREGLKIEDYLSENKISKGGDILRVSLKQGTCDIIIFDDITTFLWP